MTAPRHHCTLLRYERREPPTGGQRVSVLVNEEDVWAFREEHGGSPDIIEDTEAGQWDATYTIPAPPLGISADGRYTIRDNERNGEAYRILNVAYHLHSVKIRAESTQRPVFDDAPVVFEPGGAYLYASGADESELVPSAGMVGEFAYLNIPAPP